VGKQKFNCRMRANQHRILLPLFNLKSRRRLTRSRGASQASGLDPAKCFLVEVDGYPQFVFPHQRIEGKAAIVL
jgi:hypothetical protein